MNAFASGFFAQLVELGVAVRLDLRGIVVLVALVEPRRHGLVDTWWTGLGAS